MSIEFYYKSEKYYELTNFHVCSFNLDNKIWQTVEHYFQAQKYPSDINLQETIRLAKSPFIAKRLGRSITPHFRSDWEEVKENIMKKGLIAKFTQNNELYNMLKETNNLILKEKSPADYYWGIGTSGKGKNRLGILLMEVRSEI